jgi:MoaA/NifB/PqqE/SkfB family radical SAM enzyme
VNAVLTRLPILILYPHNRCNCRCVMCDIWKIASVQEITGEELEGHARDLEALGTEWVVFSGGEPLMHSDLFRLARRLRRAGMRATLLTTGLLLQRHAAAVVESLDDVIVSLDGPPEVHDRIRRVPRAFELLAAGVRALHARDPRFPVAARCTVQRANFDRLCDAAAAARDLGLQSISFLAADLTSSAFNRTGGWPAERAAEIALEPHQIKSLERELDLLAQQGDGFVREDAAKLRRIARHFAAHLGLVQPEAPRCNAPWVSAVLESDGTVRPCFFHRVIGNARERPLRDVLNSEEAVSFRRDLDVAEDPTCRRCVCSLYLER